MEEDFTAPGCTATRAPASQPMRWPTPSPSMTTTAMVQALEASCRHQSGRQESTFGTVIRTLFMAYLLLVLPLGLPAITAFILDHGLSIVGSEDYARVLLCGNEACSVSEGEDENRQAENQQGGDNVTLLNSSAAASSGDIHLLLVQLVLIAISPAVDIGS
ncbi:hypothetical protein BP6252_03565 [Coleophoma cylindrospora]|uniref:Uncharacterized protein n=1 Tax=Coleophoma cylindrospora TaxID=1849047 RepID=A0A3D8S812_9HELO|nr:hypothetical protein BP6252_03565 [Coleophoma cylindrospora]